VDTSFGVYKGGYGQADQSADVGTLFVANVELGLTLTLPFGLYLGPLGGFSYMWLTKKHLELQSAGSVKLENAGWPLAGGELGYLFGRRQKGRMFFRFLVPPWDSQRLAMPFVSFGMAHAL
jgi:hypothetical protein